MKFVAKFMVLLLLFGTLSQARAEACVYCHQEAKPFSPYHQNIACVDCHFENENPGPTDRLAHDKYESFPGRMATAKRSCGQDSCHLNYEQTVSRSIMNSLEGMVAATKRVFDEPYDKQKVHDLDRKLSNKGADSYLRKLCVSCHLGNERKNHGQSIKDRGGGCSACHLKTWPKIGEVRSKTNPNLVIGGAHPTLTLAMESENCFGCHSRSGRISLNYYGYAEVERTDPARITDFGRLPDKRLVERLQPDLHKTASMDCVDCHTENGLMGMGDRPRRHSKQLDIACEDCHGIDPVKKSLKDLSKTETRLMAIQPEMGFLDSSKKVFATTRKNSPLFQLNQKAGKRVLRTKKGKRLKVPLAQKGEHHDLAGHQRLSCDACHAAWTPKCYGCHISYDPNQSQWDHLKKKKTAGRWTEKRWYIINAEPALGVSGERIVPFVPGMNLIIDQPGKPRIEKRIFTPSSPHTTQKKSRSCASCHSNPRAWGEIQKWVPAPFDPNLKTPDGWIVKGQKRPGKSLFDDARSFNRKEISRIERVGNCLGCHPYEKQAWIFVEYQKSLREMINSKTKGH